MFEMDVVSDPIGNISVDGWVSNDKYKAITEFDESLIKPALLLADCATLYTMRVDFSRSTDAEAFANSNMPMRFLHSFAAVCEADEPTLQLLGLNRSTLPSRSELALFGRDKELDEEWWEAVSNFEKKYKEQILDYRSGFHKILRARHFDLESEGLSLAESKGVLKVLPWNANEVSPFHLSWDTVKRDYFESAVSQMADRLVVGTSPISIEPAARASITPSPPTSNLGSETTMQVSTVLANQVPGLALMTVSEILDLRSDNQAYLAPFRSAIFDVAQGVAGAEGASLQEVEKLAKIAWEREVAPALRELEFQLERAGFGKKLLSTVLEDKGAAVAATASLALGFGTVVAGLAALVPAAMAATYPVAKALAETGNERRLSKQNRMYFLYQASKAAKKRQWSPA
ncbi:MAG: hypothetical protein RIC81_06920 [Microcella pacifica]|uniref:hypothetical protein n=1 Tax=Microcella pacifica TaxID=2591847 RepID=UPI003314A4C5